MHNDTTFKFYAEWRKGSVEKNISGEKLKYLKRRGGTVTPKEMR